MLPWEKNMRSGFDAWRIFLICEKTGGSCAWSEIEWEPKQTIHGWIALCRGSNLTKKPKPQVHVFFYEIPPNMQKMVFFEVFWGFLTVTLPNFSWIRAVCIFQRALVSVYWFSKNLCGWISIFGDIEAQKWSKTAKNVKKSANWALSRIIFFWKVIRNDLFLKELLSRGALVVSPAKNRSFPTARFQILWLIS